MKCLIVLILASVFCAAPAAAAVIAAYSGTTDPFGGPTNWNAPNVAVGDTTCTVGTTAIPYASFNVTFPSAGVYQVKCMFEDAYKGAGPLVLVYSGPTFVAATAAACTGFVKSAAENTGLSGGPPINDGIFFNAAIYFFAVTGTSSTAKGIFACQVSSSTYNGAINLGSTPVMNAVSNNQDEACSSSSTAVPGGYFNWTQPANGTYDISVYFSNTTYTTSSFGANAALYAANSAPFTLNGTANDPCVASGLIISAEYSKFAVYLQNVTLIQGQKYFVTLSGSQSDATGYWGATIDPTIIGSTTNSPVWTQPDRSDGCTASSYTAAHYFTIYFNATNPTYIFDTQSLRWGNSLDTYSFLYFGLNSAIPPATCPATATLIYQGDTGDVRPLAFQGLSVGRTYTIVVSSYGSTSAGDFAAYLFTGNQIGSLPPPPTNGAATQAGTNGAATQAGTNGQSTNAATVTGASSNPTSTAGNTSPVSTTGGSGAATLVVSFMALIVSVIAVLM
jgi:hypothetical protein